MMSGEALHITFCLESVAGLVLADWAESLMATDQIDHQISFSCALAMNTVMIYNCIYLP